MESAFAKLALQSLSRAAAILKLNFKIRRFDSISKWTPNCMNVDVHVCIHINTNINNHDDVSIHIRINSNIVINTSLPVHVIVDVNVNETAKCQCQ